jgi:exodeoxyribonuclease X
MLSKAWTFQEILQHRGLPELGILGEGHEDDGYTAEPTVMFAHNLVFDATMIEQTMPGIKLPERRACSWRCALHKYPESPAHSNQVLRYYLELKVPEYKSLPPHRALPDALVTAEIVKEMLKTSSVDELVELTSKPVLLGTVRFGKFRGMKWSELEDGYLRWILSKDFDADARYTARHWLQHRSAQKPLLQPR